MWLSLMWSPLGTWSATQACALTGNWTGNPLVHSPHSIHGATAVRSSSEFQTWCGIKRKMHSVHKWCYKAVFLWIKVLGEGIYFPVCIRSLKKSVLTRIPCSFLCRTLYLFLNMFLWKPIFYLFLFWFFKLKSIFNIILDWFQVASKWSGT